METNDVQGRGEVGEKLVSAAMLRVDGPAAAEISGDFAKIRARIDRVVQSPIADGEPTKGPIHTADTRSSSRRKPGRRARISRGKDTTRSCGRRRNTRPRTRRSREW